MDISQLNYKSPTLQKIAGTTVLFIVIIFLWYSQSYKVNKQKIRQKSEELESIRSRIQNAKMSAARVEEIYAELNRLFAQYKLIEELLPATRDVPDFIRKIYLAAKQADSPVVKLEQKSTEPKGYYNSDPYSIKIQSTYHGFGKFLSLVANLPFTALVKGVKMSASGSKKYSINVEFTIIAHHMGSALRIDTLEELRKKRAVKPGEGKKKPKKKGKKVPS